MSQSMRELKEELAERLERLEQATKKADENNAQGHQRTIANTGVTADRLDKVTAGGYAMLTEPVKKEIV